jgi:hypothetical protein
MVVKIKLFWEKSMVIILERMRAIMKLLTLRAQKLLTSHLIIIMMLFQVLLEQLIPRKLLRNILIEQPILKMAG